MILSQKNRRSKIKGHRNEKLPPSLWLVYFWCRDLWGPILMNSSNSLSLKGGWEAPFLIFPTVGLALLRSKPSCTSSPGDGHPTIYPATLPNCWLVNLPEQWRRMQESMETVEQLCRSTCTRSVSPHPGVPLLEAEGHCWRGGGGGGAPVLEPAVQCHLPRSPPGAPVLLHFVSGHLWGLCHCQCCTCVFHTQAHLPPITLMYVSSELYPE